MNKKSGIYNIEKIWNESTWLKQARNVIDGLEKFSPSSKIIMIIRHSQRYEPEMIDENDLKNANMELTPLGCEIAQKLGEKLPKNRPIRLFHSPRNRCKETAEKIYEGFTNSGGTATFKGECESLYGIRINMQSYLDEFNKYKDHQVILRYVAGIYSPDLWPPSEIFYQKSGQKIWEQVEDASDKGIDIFISHDFHIMTFRFGWFGLPPDERWIDYLGGFAFSITGDDILLSDYGKFFKIGIPYWWKNKQSEKKTEK